MLGWFRADAACASRWNRARACGSRATSPGRNLSATKRWRRVSSALYTTPIPPPPSFSMTRKCEMVWPIMEQAILRSAMLGAWKARVNGSGRQTDGIVQMTGYGISVERSPSAFRFEAPCENSRIVGNREAIVSYRKNRARTIRLGLETFAQRPRLSSSGRACALADKISSMLLEERVARPVTEREAVQLARDLYGLEVAAKSLPGEYDDNFHLTPVGAGPSGSRDGASPRQGVAAGLLRTVLLPAPAPP